MNFGFCNVNTIWEEIQDSPNRRESQKIPEFSRFCRALTNAEHCVIICGTLQKGLLQSENWTQIQQQQTEELKHRKLNPELEENQSRRNEWQIRICAFACGWFFILRRRVNGKNEPAVQLLHFTRILWGGGHRDLARIRRSESEQNKMN